LEEVLILFKADLGISSTAKDNYFSKHIENCKAEIENKGITLDLVNTEDIMLLADYASWNYRKRMDNVPLSNNLQSRLNNRKVKARSERVEVV
jgi:hypothetical protein